MNPGSWKVAAIGFALVSLTLLTVAAREWSSQRDSTTDPAAGRGNLAGGLILFAVSLLLLGGLLAAAAAVGWHRDRTLWIGLGSFLALMTVVRPWWFWENWKARWLRNLIGDEATVVVYLMVAGVMVWVGLATDWTFGRR